MSEKQTRTITLTSFPTKQFVQQSSVHGSCEPFLFYSSEIDGGCRLAMT